MKTWFIYGAFLLTACLTVTSGICQSQKDTAEINALIKRSRAFIDLPARTGADLQKSLDLALRAVQLSRRTRMPVIEGRALHALSESHSAMGHTEEGRSFAKQALEIFQRSGDRPHIARALIALGGSYSNEKEDLPEKIKYYEQGIQLFHELKDTSSEASLSEFLTDLYMISDDLPRALQKAGETLRLYQMIGHHRLQGIYNLLGSIYSDMDSVNLAVEYNMLAAKTGEMLKDSGGLMVRIYNWLGISYFNVAFYDQSLEYYRKGLAMAEAAKDTTSIIWIQQNMGQVLPMVGRHQEALALMQATIKDYPGRTPAQDLHASFVLLKLYTSLYDHDLGMVYYKKLSDFVYSPGPDDRNKVGARVIMAGFMERAGNFREAKRLLAEVQERRNTMPLGKDGSIAYEIYAYRIDSAMGDPSGALDHYKRYKLLSDSIFRMDKGMQFDRLRVQYEVEKKNADIKILTRESRLQSSAIKKEKYTKNIFIAFVVMLLLLLLMGYFAFRQKQISNLQLKASRDQIDRQNKDLQKLVSEKEWLLKEIHHRVKNNLQIVMSLLNTQSEYLSNDDAIRAVRDSQQRMHAMSLIHQRLYQGDNIAFIDMSWYIGELVDYMKECYAGHQGIEFHLEVDDIQMDVAQSVPLGLILNEAISNSMKYAFPDRRKGDIYISLKRAGGGKCFLSVADNGIGLPEGFDPANTDSLGMSLLLGLSQQLGGELQVDSNNGLKLSVIFPIHNMY